MTPAESGSCVTVRGLGLHYGNPDAPLFRDLSLDLAPGEIVALLGPSGCGKSSLLNAVAGFIPVQAGEIRVQGRPSTGPGADKAVVFQEDTLFPWLTALENVALGLKAGGMPKAQRLARAASMLELVGLGAAGQLHPAELSGGMKQRVALARVLVLEPGLLLMDEPFAALDALTREDMHELLLDLHARLRPAILFVTHEVNEAVKLADRVLLFGPANGTPGGIRAEVALELPRPRDGEDPALRRTALHLRSLLRR